MVSQAQVPEPTVQRRNASLRQHELTINASARDQSIEKLREWDANAGRRSVAVLVVFVRGVDVIATLDDILNLIVTIVLSITV